jgi:signal peptidase I
MNSSPAPSSRYPAAKVVTTILAVIGSWIVLPILIVLLLHSFVFQAYHVVGSSMHPTLTQGDYLIISKLGYTGTLIKRAFSKDLPYIPVRGQIVVFRYPKDPRQVFVKRVVGLPGDRVVIRDGRITIFNPGHPGGFNPDTAYLPPDTVTLTDTDDTVQDGQIFVIGDNRTPGGSTDSRDWGEVPSYDVIGTVVLRLLPVDHIKLF